MEASEEQISLLLELQELDLKRLHAKKQFDELPQRAAIVDVRQKLAAVKEKFEKVEKLLAVAEKKIDDIVKEDEKLEARQADIQHDIDAAGTDYRNMEARTKELAGAEKRREALVGMLEDAEAEKEKVVSVKNQLSAAAQQLSQLEAKHIASFKQEGGRLQQELARLDGDRAALVADIDAELLARYDKIAEASGVAIVQLNGTRCGVCRSPFDDVRLLDVRHQAPLAICPICKRLLVVS